MYKKTLLSLAIASTIALTGCLENDKKENDNGNAESNPNGLTQGQIAELEAAAGTYAVFNPILTAFPTPNDLMLDRSVAGENNPQEGADGTYVSSTKLSALDFLDGAGTSSSYDIPTSGILDKDTVIGTSFIPHPDPAMGGLLIPNPSQTVFLLDLTYPGGDELLSTPGLDLNADGKADLTEVPTFQSGLLYATYAAAFQALAAAATADPVDPAVVAEKSAEKDKAEAALLKNTAFRAELITLDGAESVIRIAPQTPLNPKSKYLVIVTNGVKDTDGDPLKASPSYQQLAGTDALLSGALQGVRDAIGGWQTLAKGWFGFRTDNFDFPLLDETDIALTITFTTGGTDTVLNAMAAPETFLIEKATITHKQAGITSLFDGTINFLSTGETPTTPLDGFFQGLTTNPASPLYIEAIADDTYGSYIELAGAVKAEVVGVSATDLFKVQTAAATANLSVENGDSLPGAGNGLTIATTASLTAAQLVGGGILTRPTSGITEKTGDDPADITYHDTFIPYPLLAGATPTGTVNDYRLDSQTSFGLPNPGYVMQGQIEVPYFLPDASASGTPSAVNTGTWVANSNANLGAPSSKVTYRFPYAAKQTTENIPFLLSVPKENGTTVVKPVGGWPVVIFQHGIFGARGHSIPMANQLGYGCAAGGGAQCFATIAIDLPLHGLAPNIITGASDSLTADGLNVDVQGAANSFTAYDWDAVSASLTDSGLPSDYSGLHERHFGLSKLGGAADPTPSAMDYTAGTQNPGNGYAGEYYINLALPPASRDNLRQSALDLMTVISSLGDINIDDAGGDLDTSRTYLIGHSLGGIVSTVFASVNNNPTVQSFTPTPTTIQAVALENPGGNIIRLLENSRVFGPGILAGISASSGGVAVQGTSTFETFMNVAQAAIESGDSINFASRLASDANSTPILATEIYGDGIDRLTQDDTIPLDVDEVDDTVNGLTNYFAPASSLAQNSLLASTEPLFNEMGLVSLTTSIAPGAEIQGAVRFNTGTHTTLISGDNPSVFGEMAAQLISFFSSNGTGINVGTINPAVISAADPDVSQ